MKKIRTVCALAVAAMLLSGMAGTLRAQENWDIYLTVDNQYDVYFGTSMATDTAIGGDNNWMGREYFQAIGRLPTDYLYVATASDHQTAQGFLGTFTNTTTNTTISTGNVVWEVFPAGAYAASIDPCWPDPWTAWLMPTQSQVDDAIAYATTNNLWVAPTQVNGYDNDPCTAITPYTWQWGWYFNDIEPSASWIWYDSGDDPGTANVPAPLHGFNHDEFLVFRVPGVAPEPATMAMLGLGGLAVLKRKRRGRSMVRH